MAIETVLTCPLGSKCEEVKDGKIYKCAWYVKMRGENPQTGEEIDEHGCAIAWMPIMQVEIARTNRGTNSAIESFRNETVQRQDKMISMNTIPNYNPLLLE